MESGGASDRVLTSFIRWLESLPNADEGLLRELLSHSRTQKVTSGIISENKRLGAESFLEVDHDPGFLFNCGLALLVSGNNSEDRFLLNLALKLFRELRIYFKKGSPGHAHVLMSEGIARNYLADLGMDSRENLKEAVSLHQRAQHEGFQENTLSYAKALLNEGIARKHLADLGMDSLENLEEAVRLHQRARREGYQENTPSYAGALLNEANAKLSLAVLGFDSKVNLKEAICLYQKARRKGYQKNTPSYARALMNEGNAWLSLAQWSEDPKGNLKEAVNLYQKARRKGYQKNTPSYARALMNEGTARWRLAEQGFDSEENLKEAICLLRKARSEGLQGKTSSYAGALMMEGKARVGQAELNIEPELNTRTAEKLFLQAKKIFQDSDNMIHASNVNQALGYLKYDSGDFPGAYRYLKEAIKHIEELRSTLRLPEHRKDYIETVANTYTTMTFTCLALAEQETNPAKAEAKIEEAFKHAESAKGKAFQEQLASEKKRIKGNPQLIERYRNVLRRISELELRQSRQGTRSAEQADELGYLKGEYDRLLLEIKEGDPEYYSVTAVEPLDLDELRSILDGRTLVEYFLGDKLAIFTLNPELSYKTVDVSQSDVNKWLMEIQRFVLFRRSKDAGGYQGQQARLKFQANRALERLYDALIEPVKTQLGDPGSEIIVVPHSLLHLVPFQALRKKGGRHLVEDYCLSFAQSASSLMFIKPGGGEGALVVGNTDPGSPLPYSEDEARKIAERFGVKPLIGGEATREVVLAAVPGKAVLHFACHGVYNRVSPAFSGVNLADGMLTAVDFMDLDVDAGLVVLSACDTGVSQVSLGGEVEGLVRAIQYGGARLVVASLWGVSDPSTERLFTWFYAEREGAGDDVGAFRSAVLRLKDAPGFDWRHWAAFQTYGIR